MRVRSRCDVEDGEAGGREIDPPDEIVDHLGLGQQVFVVQNGQGVGGVLTHFSPSLFAIWFNHIEFFSGRLLDRE